MARAATTTDAFNAVAEPRRRQILDLLATGARPVNDLASLLDMGQPQISKHLGVLRQVGLVGVKSDGRRRIYSLDAEPLKPIHAWLATFEAVWAERFDSLDLVLEELTAQEEPDARSD